MEREFLTKAIVLKSEDYKEKDKQVVLFSVEEGKILATLKGCKSPKAKLKFAFSPFCFAEYKIVQKGNFFTITNANLIDSFFDLTKDISKYYSCSTMLEICNHLVKFQEPNPQLFLFLLDCIKSICYDNKDEKKVLIKFCLFSLKNTGYSLQFKQCSKCEFPFNQDKFLSMDSGEFVCNNCKNLSCQKVSNVCFNSLKIIDSTNIDRFDTIKIANDVLMEGVNLLIKNLECRLERKIVSSKMLI